MRRKDTSHKQPKLGAGVAQPQAAFWRKQYINMLKLYRLASGPVMHEGDSLNIVMNSWSDTRRATFSQLHLYGVNKMAQLTRLLEGLSGGPSRIFRGHFIFRCFPLLLFHSLVGPTALCIFLPPSLLPKHQLVYLYLSPASAFSSFSLWASTRPPLQSGELYRKFVS